MEEYRKTPGTRSSSAARTAGVDAFELNMSCPHGLPERKMGAAMGENPDILEEVCGWVMEAAKVPVWAKMTPNVTHIEDPTRASLRAGCDGISAINTIRSVIGVEPRHAAAGADRRRLHDARRLFVPGGDADRPADVHGNRQGDPGRVPRPHAVSGIGGIETGNDAAQFILLGCDTVQVCTGVMKFGYRCVHEMQDQLSAFMEHHKFKTLADFKGHSLQVLHHARRPGEAPGRSAQGRQGRRPAPPRRRRAS